MRASNFIIQGFLAGYDWRPRVKFKGERGIFGVTSPGGDSVASRYPESPIIAPTHKYNGAALSVTTRCNLPNKDGTANLLKPQ